MDCFKTGFAHAELATISKQNGYQIGITRIREVAGTDKQGTNVYGVILLNLFKVLLNAFRSHLLLYLSQKLDIAKIAEGQAVKFEIVAYPSEEYGYFTGRIDSIAKDITVDQSSAVPTTWSK